MIKGLYESHLPVRSLERSIPFYESLGLKLYKRYEDTAFFWIVEEQSWLGLWEGEEYKTPYHPSLRHIAFQVDFEFLHTSIKWLKDRNITPVPFSNRTPLDLLFALTKAMLLSILKIQMIIVLSLLVLLMFQMN